jgi:hypothetical protein
VLLVVMLVGAVEAMPSPALVASRQKGVRAQLAGDDAAAIAYYRTVLAARPHAAETRLLLACVLWRTGRRGEAAENVFRAIHEGVLITRQGYCGGGLDLSRYFVVTPIGATDILVVYVASTRDPLVARALDQKLGYTERLADASCLGLNAGFAAFGAEPLNQLPANQGIPQLMGCLHDFRHWFVCIDSRDVAVNPREHPCRWVFAQEQQRRAELSSAGIGGG